jgi:histidinol dehydrogenase
MPYPGAEDAEAAGGGAHILYAAYSRRAGGLSLGVNLFPKGKKCSFDCPYCEVFPYPPGEDFSVSALERELAAFFGQRHDSEFPGTPVRDICLSGSGEPCLSPHLEPALYAMAAARGRYCPEAGLTLITNSTGFLSSPVLDVLDRFARKLPLDVWAKLDAGTEQWFKAMSRSRYSLDEIVSGIERYAAMHPLIIQTMVCALDGQPPEGGEMAAYASRLEQLLENGADLAAVQLYTQARPSPHGRTSPLPERFLMEIAQRVREATQGRVPVRVYGER